jgi:hypothetical protein
VQFHLATPLSNVQVQEGKVRARDLNQAGD